MQLILHAVMFICEIRHGYWLHKNAFCDLMRDFFKMLKIFLYALCLTNDIFVIFPDTVYTFQLRGCTHVHGI